LINFQVTDLITWAYKDVEWARFAALSRYVFEAAEKSDKVAIEIIQRAAVALFSNLKVTFRDSEINKVL
jgi:N-acetylglucosamine kinase-like BadF-type ATPase